MDLESYAGKVIVFKFYADWCGPCKTLSPIVQKVASDTSVQVIDVDIEEESVFTSMLGVRSVPTLISWNGSKAIGTIVGSRPEPTIRAFFNNLLEAVEVLDDQG